MKLFKLRHGFTLIELLIVIAIIGILVTVGAASYSQAQKKGRDSRRQSDMKAVQNAMEQWYADSNGVYTTTGNDCNPGTAYLPGGFPSDPKPGESYTRTTCGSASAYCVCAEMENSTQANADINCSYTAGNKTHFCVSNLQ